MDEEEEAAERVYTKLRRGKPRCRVAHRATPRRLAKKKSFGILGIGLVGLTADWSLKTRQSPTLMLEVPAAGPVRDALDAGKSFYPLGCHVIAAVRAPVRPSSPRLPGVGWRLYQGKRGYLPLPFPLPFPS